MNKAIELYPFTVSLKKIQTSNSFLRDFKIDFHQPDYGLATLYCDRYVPERIWFSFFEEAEKQVIDDDYNFFGVIYHTSVELARKRVQVLNEKLSKLSMNKVPERDRWVYTRAKESIQQIKQALDMLRENDHINLEFLFKEWPSSEEMKATDYVKEFQDRVMSYKGKSLTSIVKDSDIPF